MWAILKAMLAAVPTAATSREGLIAFAITATAYVISVWRVSRNRNLLSNLHGKRPTQMSLGLDGESSGRLEFACVSP
jgi:hypothetical protein